VNVNYRVLGLDPGGTTGWALYDAELLPSPDDDGQDELVEQRLTVGHFGPHEHHLELYEAMEHWQIHDFTIVCESFEFRQGKQRHNINLMSKEYIGLVKMFNQDRGAPAVFQTAGQAKPFVTDAKLKAMGWYHPGWKHANDATRHLVYYLVNKKRRHDLIESWRTLV
jgi:hypothetical protein